MINNKLRNKMKIIIINNQKIKIKKIIIIILTNKYWMKIINNKQIKVNYEIIDKINKIKNIDIKKFDIQK